MHILIHPDAASVAQNAAQLLIGAATRKPDQVLGLATGRTMEAVYARLCAAHEAGSVNFSRATTFNLDEYLGLDYLGLLGAHPQSYRHYMHHHLFDRVGLPPERAHVPDGTAANPDRSANDYEAAITAAGGIDVQLLGLGENGHIGFNEPLSGLNSRTRVVTLAQETIIQNAAMFDNTADAVPRRAITMGIATILQARTLLLLACGKAKARAVAHSIEGPLSAAMPGSAIQQHPRCIVLLDEAAASALTHRDQIDWQMHTNPVCHALRAGHLDAPT